MKNLVRLVLLLAGCGALGAQITFTNLSQMLSFNAATIAPNTSISLLGRNTMGDGAGGEFRALIGPNTTTAEFIAGTNGVYHPMSNRANGWYERVDKDIIDPRWWGAVGGTNPLTAADSTLAGLAAIAYAESRGGLVVEFKGALAYRITNLTVRTAKIRGEVIQRTSPTSPAFGTTLYQPPGITNGTSLMSIVVDSISQEYATPTVENLILLGSKSANQYFPKQIVSVVATNRLAFFVAVGDLPDDPPDATLWPHYGHCFFYTDDPYYAGSSVVESVNRTTGEVTLLQSYGTPYATPTATPGVLDADWTVVFSPVVTEAGRIVGTFTDVSPAYAGNAGVSITGTTVAALLQTAVIRNVDMRNFHVGIRKGISIHEQIENSFTIGSGFAGQAGSFALGARDTIYGGRNYLGSFAVADHGEATPSLTDARYAHSAYGAYNLASASFGELIVADNPVTGFYLIQTANSLYSKLRVDGAIGNAYHFGGTGVAADWDRSDVHIDTLSALAPNAWPETYRTPRNVIYTSPQTGLRNNFSIGAIHIDPVGGTNGYFDAIFDIATSDVVKVGTIVGREGVNAFYSATSASALIGPHNWLTSPILAGDGLWRSEFSQGGLGLALGGTNRISFNLGGTIIDAIGNAFHVGADSATGTNRTDATEKSFSLQIPAYNVSSNFAGLRFLSGAANNNFIIGGLGGAAAGYEGMTELFIEGTTEKGIPPSIWAQWRDARLAMRSSLTLSNAIPELAIIETDAASTNQYSSFRKSGGTFLGSFHNDAGAGAKNWLVVIPQPAATDANLIQLKTLDRGLHILGSGADTNDTGLNWLVGSTIYGPIKREPATGYLYTSPLVSGGGGTNGITDGDKGDITVSGSGTNWQVNPNVLTTNDFKLLIAQDMIQAGSNVVLTTSGNKVVINATGNGGGVGSTNALTMYGYAVLSITNNLGMDVWDIDQSVSIYGGHVTNASGFGLMSSLNGGLINIDFDETRADTNYFVMLESESLISSGHYVLGIDNGSVGRGPAGFAIWSHEYNGQFAQLDGWIRVMVYEVSAAGGGGSGTNIPLSDLSDQPTGLLGVANGPGPVTIIEPGDSATIEAESLAGGVLSYTYKTNNLFLLDRGTNVVPGHIEAGSISTPVFTADNFDVTSTLDTAQLQIGGTNIFDLFGSGKTIASFVPLDMTYGTNTAAAAVFAYRGDGRLVLAFDDTTQECVFFEGVIPEGADLTSGISASVWTMAASATSGVNSFTIAFEKLEGFDLDGNSFATSTNINLTANATSGVLTKGTVVSTFTDSLAAEDAYRIQVCRDPNVGSDMTGDAQLVRVHLKTAN